LASLVWDYWLGFALCCNSGSNSKRKEETKMNRLTLAILASAVAMFTTLMIFDVYQLITTPLTPYGVNHWIPELLAIFLFGRLLTKRKIKPHLILLGVFIYTPLTYWLMYGSLASVQLGIGTRIYQ